MGLESPKHGPESNQTHGLSIELPHLAEDLGMLDALDDQAFIEEDVVEEASFERALGRRRAIEAARGSSPNRTASRRSEDPAHLSHGWLSSSPTSSPVMDLMIREMPAPLAGCRVQSPPNDALAQTDHVAFGISKVSEVY